jgi:hypothetical protein
MENDKKDALSDLFVKKKPLRLKNSNTAFISDFIRSDRACSIANFAALFEYAVDSDFSLALIKALLGVITVTQESDQEIAAGIFLIYTQNPDFRQSPTKERFAEALNHLITHNSRFQGEVARLIRGQITLPDHDTSEPDRAVSALKVAGPPEHQSPD